MKKTILTISIITLIISLIVIIIRLIPIKPFYLNDEYYGLSEIKEITIEELNELSKEKHSFALLIYQPMCLVSTSFNEIVENYSKTNQITFYKMAFSDIKDTSLNKKVTYYPSLILYKDGKIKTYLDATKNSDIEYFSSQKGFENWFEKYIKVKKIKNENKPEQDNTIDTDLSKDKIILDEVKKEETKVNIYFFWGNGCPHCKEEFEFFNEIEKEYGSMYNLYTYETWYNEKYATLAKELGKLLNVDIKGVPFTIIGEKSFSGFGEKIKEEIKNTIQIESKKNFDVYLDKYKNAN